MKPSRYSLLPDTLCQLATISAGKHSPFDCKPPATLHVGNQVLAMDQHRFLIAKLWMRCARARRTDVQVLIAVRQSICEGAGELRAEFASQVFDLEHCKNLR